MEFTTIIIVTRGWLPLAWIAFCMSLEVILYLSNQTGEHKDTSKEVGHLETDLKHSARLRKTPDVDQTTNSEVITTQVPVGRKTVTQTPNPQ